MIAVDTNVLVRYMVCDDAEQARLARSLLEKLSSNRPGLISREVAIELVWVLERAYRFSRDQIVSVLEELVSTEGLVVEAADDVVRVSSIYRRGGVGFSDLMILAAAERLEAKPVYTFDRAFARLEGAALVEDATIGELP